MLNWHVLMIIAMGQKSKFDEDLLYGYGLTDALHFAYIELDLFGQEYDIAQVLIWNLKDACQDRIVGTALQLFNSNKNIAFAFRLNRFVGAIQLKLNYQ